MTHEKARLALAAILRDDHRRPEGTVAYAYRTGCYAVYLHTDDGDYLLLDEDAVNVYRTTHRPPKEDIEHGAQQGQGEGSRQHTVTDPV